jgi:RNA polymerase sigma factor (sigma-70 family)
MTDGELLECFLSGWDDRAFAALVRRHAAMVWGVCRRVLICHQDAEDAFQSTFLVLVRKAASVTPRHMIANWLYGVAHQTALNARASAARRRARERQVTEMPEPAGPEQKLWLDLQPILDQELSRLPARYRSAIVLCDLEGKTRKDAAAQFGVPQGNTCAPWRPSARNPPLIRHWARPVLSLAVAWPGASSPQPTDGCSCRSSASSKGSIRVGRRHQGKR